MVGVPRRPPQPEPAGSMTAGTPGKENTMVRVRKIGIALNGEGRKLPMPQVIRQTRLGFDRLVKAMSNGGEVAGTEVRATFQRFENALLEELVRGNRVETPVGTFFVSVGVGQRGEDGDFELLSKNVRLNFRPSPRLAKRVQAEVELELIAEPPNNAPYIACIENATREGCTESLRANELIYLTGLRLDFAHDDPEQGVFFTSTDGTALRVTSYGHCGSREIAFVVPTLPEGEYQLDVRSGDGDRKKEKGSYEDLVAIESTAPAN